MIVESAIFLILLSSLLILYLNKFGVSRDIWGLAFVSFTLRGLYVTADRVLGIYAGGGDQAGYDATFWFVAQRWRDGDILGPLHYGLSPGNTGDYMLVYSTVFSPPYVIFGHVEILPRLEMALFGALVVVNIYLITEALAGHRAGLVAAAIAAIFPYWVVLSGIIYRDMFIIFLITFFAYYLVRWQSGDRTIMVLLTIVIGIGIALSLRRVNIVAVVAMVVIAAFTMVDRRSTRVLGTATSGAIVGGIAYASLGSFLVVERLAGRRSWLARDNPGAYLSDVTYQSIPELLAFAPIGATYFLLTPFPWQPINVLAMVAIAQNLFLWYPVVVLSVVGFRDVIHLSDGKATVLPLVAFCLAGIFAYGLVEGNIGPAMRHRSQFQFIFFVLAGVALGRRIRIRTDVPES